MWQEKGTDEVDNWGHETWDKNWTSNNEYYIWWDNDQSREAAQSAIDDMMCAGRANNQFSQ